MTTQTLTIIVIVILSWVLIGFYKKTKIPDPTKKKHVIHSTPPTQPQPDLPLNVQQALRDGNKVEAIKLLREQEGLDLLQAKTKVEAYIQ